MNSKQKGGGTADKGNLNQPQQSGGGQKQGGTDKQQDSRIDQQRGAPHVGSQQQGNPGQRQSNDQPASPPRRQLSGDEDMDDDTGLSNRANRQSADVERGKQQSGQSNVGRRDDGTPD